MTVDETPKLTLLHVEDNPGDVRLVQEAVNGSSGDVEYRATPDGQSTLDLLLPEDSSNGFRPDLVLLDYHLPDMTGVTVLRTIKQHPELRRIPVVVFSDDDSEKAIAEMYDAHANAYVTKPNSLDDYERIVRCLGQFWGGITELPLAGEEG